MLKPPQLRVHYFCRDILAALRSALYVLPCLPEPAPALAINCMTAALRSLGTLIFRFILSVLVHLNTGSTEESNQDCHCKPVPECICDGHRKQSIESPDYGEGPKKDPRNNNQYESSSKYGFHFIPFPFLILLI
jgi:hypothetical protein